MKKKLSVQSVQKYISQVVQMASVKIAVQIKEIIVIKRRGKEMCKYNLKVPEVLNVKK